jgi:hypothetical protein
VLSKEPPLTLNALGIKFAKKEFMSWKYITNDFIDIRRSGKYTHHFIVLEFHNQKQEIQIDDLDIKVKEVENLLHVYRVRYEKNNPS